MPFQRKLGHASFRPNQSTRHVSICVRTRLCHNLAELTLFQHVLGAPIPSLASCDITLNMFTCSEDKEFYLAQLAALAERYDAPWCLYVFVQPGC